MIKWWCAVVEWVFARFRIRIAMERFFITHRPNGILAIVIIIHLNTLGCYCARFHDDIIKWKHFPRYWPFVRGIHRSPVNSPHKGQWRGALIFLLICAWINGCANNREAGYFRRHRAHYDVTVMSNFLLPDWCQLESLTVVFKVSYNVASAVNSV